MNARSLARKRFRDFIEGLLVKPDDLVPLWQGAEGSNSAGSYS
jgi:hypothetical protein